MQYGKITKGKNTNGHAERLKKAGYVVEDKEKFIQVETNGFVEGDIDISTTAKLTTAAQSLISEKKLWSYATRFITEGGKIKHSIMAASVLGELSCLMAKPIKAGVNKGADLSTVLKGL